MNNPSYAAKYTRFMTTLKEILLGRDKTIENSEDFVKPQESDWIKQIDYLYDKRKYVEVYNLLNRVKCSSDVKVLWRFSRTLFALSNDESLAKVMRVKMINEAYYYIKMAIAKHDDNAEVHKWMAIVLDTKTAYDGTYSRVKTMSEVKKHLLRAIELNPSDIMTCYMLGHFCYQIANLTWFQRKLAAIMFGPPPITSHEEAFHYFSNVEKLRPRLIIKNVYMLGKVCYCMKQYYKAKYYLDIAANMPCRTDEEKEVSQAAKKLCNELKHYGLPNHALF